MLFIIENNLNEETVSRLMRQASKEDCLLLINEGVYLAHWFAHDPSATTCYVCIDHANQRGIALNVEQGIDMTEIVDLTALHSLCVTY